MNVAFSCVTCTASAHVRCMSHQRDQVITTHRFSDTLLNGNTKWTSVRIGPQGYRQTGRQRCVTAALRRHIATSRQSHTGNPQSPSDPQCKLAKNLRINSRRFNKKCFYRPPKRQKFRRTGSVRRQSVRQNQPIGLDGDKLR